ncbi:hypothetical protein BH11ACT3_BH11ACT3_02050 [soil metagenome]
MTETRSTVSLIVHGVEVPIDRSAFSTLFGNSIVSSRAPVLRALSGDPITWSKFVDLTRQAEIPYPLFFAPLAVVDEQLRLKNSKLLAGFNHQQFSVNSRNIVELRDVELIVKNLLHKQQLLRRHDRSLHKNGIVGRLKREGPSIAADAALLMRELGLESAEIQGARTKGAAIKLLIDRLESKQILVAQATKDYMPQTIPKWTKFSGMTIRDSKVPYIFLAGDEGERWEPDGRRLFTLTLLTVLMARDIFAPMSYGGHTKDPAASREYQLTEQLLMPADQVDPRLLRDLDGIRVEAGRFRVTPSAMTVRSWHLGHLSRERFEMYMDDLRAAFAPPTKHPYTAALPGNALRKYNGREASRRLLALLDAGSIRQNDFRRIVLLNRSTVSEFRSALQ